MNAQFTFPRIDVNTASREKLIAHIDNLEAALAHVYPTIGDAARFQYLFGLTAAEALVLAGLAKRGMASREHLRNVSGRWGDKDNIRVVDVLMVRIRRKLAPFGVKIRSDWGVGFKIEPEYLKLLRNLRDGEAAA